MIKNYLITAVRTLLKHKGYATVNIVGLAAGIACCLLILLFVQDELSYDRFHADADRIYRFAREFTRGAPIHFPYTPRPLVPALRTEFPGIQTMRMAGNGPWSLIRSQDKQFQETKIFWADSNFFSFFSFPLKHGNPSTALAKPNSIVLTEAMARKYFGKEDPIGKRMNIDNTYDVMVTGVFGPIPANTHFHPDFLVSLSTQYPFWSPQSWQSWGNNFLYTYFKLPPEYTLERFQVQMPQFLQKYAQGDHKTTVLHIMKMTDIHLHSHLDGELEQNGDSTTVYLFAVIALFILLLACINYMNLATARASLRMKEIGIRKTLGAVRSALVAQFLGEAFLLSFIALLAGFTISEILLPAFNQLSGKSLGGGFVLNPPILLWGVGIWLIVGLLSGSYPALILSSFVPVQVLKAGGTATISGRRLRQVLVVSQFTISTALIICTFVVQDQMSFVRNRRLGLDKEQMLQVTIPDTVVLKQFDALKARFRSVPGVGGVGGAQIPPARPLLNSTSFTPALAGGSERMGANPAERGEDWIFRFVTVDDDFFGTMKIPLVAGRYFSKEHPSDEKAYILNELAVKRYGWKSPEEALGKELIQNLGSPLQSTGPIVGVVKDAHFESLRAPLKAMVFLYRPRNLSSFVIKIDGRDVRGTYTALEQEWRRAVPNWPFVATFLDADYEALYRSDERLGTVFGVFSLFAVFIACLGLTGLGAFVIEQRTKEIGIRKVLGASVGQIVGLLSKDFMLLVLIAFAIASPIAYAVMTRWLEDFAYRITMGPGLYLMAGTLALLIAWLTVSYLSVRAALANPVRSLRYE